MSEYKKLFTTDCDDMINDTLIQRFEKSNWEDQASADSTYGSNAQMPIGNQGVLAEAIKKFSNVLVYRDMDSAQLDRYFRYTERSGRHIFHGHLQTVQPSIDFTLDMLHVLGSTGEEVRGKFLENIDHEGLRGAVEYTMTHENFKAHVDNAKRSVEDALTSLYLLADVVWVARGAYDKEVMNDSIDNILNGENFKEHADKLTDFRDKVQELSGQIQDMLGTTENDKAEEDREGDEDVEQGGMDRGTEGHRCADVTTQEAAYRLSSLFCKDMNWLDLIGQSIEVADEEMKDLVPGDTTVTGVTYGNDPTSAMPHELAMPGEVFNVRSAEGGLTQYERSDLGFKGRGPIVLVVDQSGSMDSNAMPFGNSAISSTGMAQAITLACLRTAAAQRRPFVAVQFSGHAEVVCSLENAAEATSKDYLAVLTRWVGGGTHLASGLGQAQELIETYDLQGADIVCISDGDWEPWGKYSHRVPTPNDSAIQLAQWLAENEVGLISLNTFKIHRNQDLARFVAHANPELRTATIDDMNTVEAFTEGLRETLSVALSTDSGEE